MSVVEELRCAPDFDQPDIAELYEEAAAEIERLRAALRQALNAMEGFDGEGWTAFIDPIHLAKAVLKP